MTGISLTIEERIGMNRYEENQSRILNIEPQGIIGIPATIIYQTYRNDLNPLYR